MGTEENRCFTKVSFMIIIIIILVGASIPLLRSSDGISHCATTILLDDAKKTVIHENFNDSIVRFSGSATLAIPMNVGSDKVYFSVSINSTHFPSSNVPLLIFDKSHNILEFNFTLVVPFDTPQRVGYSVSVSGRYGYNLSQMHYTVNPATCIIVIKQYHALELDCPDRIEIRAGNTEKIYLNMTNKGNSGDRVRIEISKLDQFAERGWDFQLSQDKCGFPANSWKKVPLRIEIPENEKPGVYKLQVSLYSAQAESLGDPSIMDIQHIEIEVLNNYKDEVVIGSIIAGPLIMLFAIIIIIIKVKKKKERGVFE